MTVTNVPTIVRPIRWNIATKPKDKLCKDFIFTLLPLLQVLPKLEKMKQSTLILFFFAFALMGRVEAQVDMSILTKTTVWGLEKEGTSYFKGVVFHSNKNLYLYSDGKINKKFYQHKNKYLRKPHIAQDFGSFFNFGYKVIGTRIKFNRSYYYWKIKKLTKGEAMMTKN